jgi:hypothetical protein
MVLLKKPFQQSRRPKVALLDAEKLEFEIECVVVSGEGAAMSEVDGRLTKVPCPAGRPPGLEMGL